MPTKRTNEKPRMTSPPRKKSAATVRNVRAAVRNVRERVSLIDRLTRGERASFFGFSRFSRIRS